MAATAIIRVAVAACLSAAPARAVEASSDCPASNEPYSDEPNHFGWPLAANDWTWGNPNCWNKTQGGYVSCGGIRQSPMNIDLSQGVTDGGEAAGALDKASEYRTVQTPKVKISVQMRTAFVQGDFGSLTLQSETGKPIVYDAYEVHLTASSLHSVNGQHHAGEVMIFHKPRGQANALTDAVIVSALLEESTVNSSAIFYSFGFGADGGLSVKEERDSEWTASDDVDLAATLKPALAGSYWKYDGSVPVPPCSETVKWFILETPIYVKKAHTNALHQLLQKYAGSAGTGNNKRPPVARKNRAIVMNTLKPGGSHQADSCATFKASDQARSAVCWPLMTPQCGMGSQSPVPLSTSSQLLVTDDGATETSALKLAQYRVPMPSYDLVVAKPTTYSLDVSLKHAGDDFGHLALHGRIFPVRSISVKAVANHVVEGVRYPAELVIEHSEFGDVIRDTAMYPDYNPAEHIVKMSVPIKIGQENTLLRQMGLGTSTFKTTIKHKLAYSPIEDVDLMAGLKDSLAGTWYWYNGSKTLPDCRESVKWLVLTTPIEASLDQINYLALDVPGEESTRFPSDRGAAVDPNVYLDHMPPHAIQMDKTCPGAHEFFNYQNTHCWGECSSGCSETCMTGTMQSPVNIDTSLVTKTKSDNFLHQCRWRPVSGLHIVNTGLGFTVANSQFGYIEQIGTDGFPCFYQVVQLSLHMPSEHTLNGKQFHGELHVIHAKQISNEELDYDDMLTVAVMLEIGDMESPLLRQLLSDDAHSQHDAKPAASGGYAVSEYPIDLMRALGPVIEGPFYSYKGSLTTPPCQENMKWLVFETPQTMSKDQWVEFKSSYANPANNRPVQLWNGRALAKNSFDAPGEDKTLTTYDFWGGRDYGRYRRDPSTWEIAIPIIGTLMLCVFAMAATFVNQEPNLKHESAGGMKEYIGKGAYQGL